MRRTHSLMIPCGLLLVGTVLWAGCGKTQSNCVEGQGNCAELIQGGGGSTSSSTMTTASGTMASSSTGMDPTCDGEISEEMSEEDRERLISDKCGVFVRADATGPLENGTQAAPYRSLQTAIDEAKGNKRVYSCAKAPYAEALTIAVPTAMYGSFECDQDWVWKAATRSLITGKAPSVTLTLTTQAEGARIEGFKITSASATGQTGESSIAVAVDAIQAELVACDVEAGAGADGVDGVPPAGTVMKGMDAPTAFASNACVPMNQVIGGDPGTTMCSDDTTKGGVGGTGGITGMSSGNGQSGMDGTPMDAVDGQGGAGESNASCKDGVPGKAGKSGLAGVPNSAPGELSLVGIVSPAGSDGQPGLSGHGGGGGGGAKAGVFCKVGASTVDGIGASGGGGGAGGCGGKGGGGGKAGGSSIAIVSLGTKLQLTKVTLTSGKGGTGGKGAPGQGGGDVGAGAVGGAASGIAGSSTGCQGGKGGKGGDGGPGAGGRGGHSLGLAVVGKLVMSAVPLPSTPGEGGVAGAGGTNGGKGLGGTKDTACWDFSTNSACPSQ